MGKDGKIMVSIIKRKRVALLTLGLLCGLFILFTSCQLPSFINLSGSKNTPQVVITELQAELVGKLEMVDGCLRVKSPSGNSYALAWVPNLKATIYGDEVNVAIGIVQKVKREVVIKIGDKVGFVGGSTPLDEQTQKSLSANCVGPYWVVANIYLFPDPKKEYVITATPDS